MSEARIDPKYLDDLKRLVVSIEEIRRSMMPAGPTYQGRVNKLPWSGWWWPMLQGPAANLYDPGGPLEKYDKYVKKKAGIQSNSVKWAKANHYTTNPANGWWGHCNGWAAAAILEPEPTKPKTKNGITFSVGDQKGLMSEAHWYDPADLIPKKFGNKAHGFHKILLDWVGKGKTSVVLDVSAGNQVWNYPVAVYQMQYEKDAADPKKNHVTCTIWFADDAVAPDYVGTQKEPLKSYPNPYGKVYNYWLSGDISNPSDGEWEKGSVYDHPDFAWHPVYVPSGFHGAFGYGDKWVKQVLS